MVNGFRSSRHAREILLADWKDAEELAAWYMREALGMTRVRRTAAGNDRGIDVTADQGVAQVKHEAKPVGAPVVQGALGAGHGHQKVLFFALSGFTQQALDFAQRAGLALFSYDIYGSVAPRNAEAISLLAAKTMDTTVGTWSRAQQLQDQANELAIVTERKLHDARQALERSHHKISSLVHSLERQTDAEEDEESLSFVLAEYSHFLRPPEESSPRGSINAAGIRVALEAAGTTPSVVWIQRAASEFLALHLEVADVGRLRRLALHQWVGVLDGWAEQEARIAFIVSAVVSGHLADPTTTREADLIVLGLAAQQRSRLADRWRAGLAQGGDLEALNQTVASDPMGRGRRWSRRVLAQYRGVEWVDPDEELDEEILAAEAAGFFWDPTRFVLGSSSEDIEALTKVLRVPKHRPFFDDQLWRLEGAAEEVPSVHVPFDVENESTGD